MPEASAHVHTCTMRPQGTLDGVCAILSAAAVPLGCLLCLLFRTLSEPEAKEDWQHTTPTYLSQLSEAHIAVQIIVAVVVAVLAVVVCVVVMCCWYFFTIGYDRAMEKLVGRDGIFPPPA